MQRNTFFAVFCALSVGMNAFVAGVPSRPRPRLSWAEIKQLAPKNANEQDIFEVGNFQIIEQELGPRDYFADLIWYLLGLTVGAFLEFINYSLMQTKNNINAGKTRIEDALDDVDAGVKIELTNIIDNALKQAVELIGELLYKLGRVIPSLTSTPMAKAPTRVDPNDIILAILGMTLEEFLRELTDLIERSDTLLINTINSLNDIAGRVNPTVAAMLRTTVTDMTRARDLIRPVLNQLWEIMPDAITAQKN